METNEEPIVTMARTIYTRLFDEGMTTTVHPWDKLSEATRHQFTVTVAKGWEVYWDQREHLQNKARA